MRKDFLLGLLLPLVAVSFLPRPVLAGPIRVEGGFWADYCAKKGITAARCGDGWTVFVSISASGQAGSCGCTPAIAAGSASAGSSSTHSLDPNIGKIFNISDITGLAKVGGTGTWSGSCVNGVYFTGKLGGASGKSYHFIGSYGCKATSQP